MKIYLYLIILLIILPSCSSSTKQQITPICRHYALFAAITWENVHNEKVVIAVGPGKVLWHAQAVIDENLLTKWLVWEQDHFEIGRQEKFFPINIYTPTEFFILLNQGKFGGFNN